MKEKNLTQLQMASIIGIDTSTVSCFCNGKRLPGFEILVKIAQAFPDIDMNWFITGKEAMEGNTEETNEENSQMKFNFTPENKQDTNEIPVLSSHNSADKRIKRVIVLFDDGSMESYD